MRRISRYINESPDLMTKKVKVKFGEVEVSYTPKTDVNIRYTNIVVRGVRYIGNALFTRKNGLALRYDMSNSGVSRADHGKVSDTMYDFFMNGLQDVAIDFITDTQNKANPKLIALQARQEDLTKLKSELEDRLLKITAELTRVENDIRHETLF